MQKHKSLHCPIGIAPTAEQLLEPEWRTTNMADKDISQAVNSLINWNTAFAHLRGGPHNGEQRQITKTCDSLEINTWDPKAGVPVTHVYHKTGQIDPTDARIAGDIYPHYIFDWVHPAQRAPRNYGYPSSS